MVEIDLTTTETDVDWIRAARLEKAVAQGDQAAQEQLEGMHRSKMRIPTEAEKVIEDDQDE